MPRVGKVGAKKKAKHCKHCGESGHKSKECPGMEEGPKTEKAISCLQWIPQAASHQPLHEDDTAKDDDELDQEINDAASDDSETEMTLKETDYVFACGRTNERKSDYTLEVMIYDDRQDVQFLRSDLYLAKPPLDLAWMDFSPGGDHGSAVAVATLSPFIEVFDLLRPSDIRAAVTLGGCKDEDDKYMDIPHEELLTRLVKGSHTDAVLSVNWNTFQRNVLASGSADKTVKLWNLATGECAQTLKHHRSEVLHVRWCPTSPFHLLTSGMMDNSVCLAHVGDGSKPLKWNIGCRADSVVWHPHQENMFLVGTDTGKVLLYDRRNNSEAVGSLLAHPGKEVSCMATNRHIPGLLATGSDDKSIALWDIRSSPAKEITREVLGMGEVFCLDFNPNNPLLLGGGGSKAQHLVWDVRSAIKSHGFTLGGAELIA
eukprot:NODE_2093_length_1514_cov_11.253055_g1992_i0.p1 GENE.NODE_2093_length_1514_cov_11.253055_g1992_i0~~NODE_2093_length_1514_cov_11.253055_g1992_i0.p1  ORF type:complete len:429 (+),score=58.39 NODE_2093_length_1514_cov_11.253055_g1992_i0:109-1395(+)